jgi:hypothetical protein
MSDQKTELKRRIQTMLWRMAEKMMDGDTGRVIAHGADAVADIGQGRPRPGAWWHWIGNLWLMTTRNEDLSAKEIRNQIRELSRDARAVVLETSESIDWATSSVAKPRASASTLTASSTTQTNFGLMSSIRTRSLPNGRS